MKVLEIEPHSRVAVNLSKARRKRLLLRLPQQPPIDLAAMFAAIPALLDGDNVRSTAKRREQIRSVTRGKEFSEVIGSVREPNEIILGQSPGGGENGVDEIMAELLLAEMHLQPIRDEGEQLGLHLPQCQLTFHNRERAS